MFDGKIERLDTNSFTSPSSTAMKNSIIPGVKGRGLAGNAITKPSI
jgi:hypothetical protein